jgi:predicted TIM-barrel fold metal-dependent hydrolase
MSEEISWLDCNVSVGAHRAGVFKPCPNAADLLAEMDWVGVDQALVHHALMREQSPVVGNAALSESIAGYPRLVGTWAILPPQTGELPGGAEFFHAMAAANVRALWACPEDHHYVLDRRTFGSFLDEVAERRVPLLLPRDAGGPRWPDTWNLAYHLLEEYPNLTLVMMAHGPWGEDRYFRPLLESAARFCLDISRYELDCGLRDVVARYGAGRLLYGSNYPRTSMGGPRLMLAHGDIDDAARRAIAGDNLRHLLQEEDLS